MTNRDAAVHIADELFTGLVKVTNDEPCLPSNEVARKAITDFYEVNEPEVLDAIVYGVLMTADVIIRTLPPSCVVAFNDNPERVRDFVVLKHASMIADSVGRGIAETKTSGVRLRPTN